MASTDEVIRELQRRGLVPNQGLMNAVAEFEKVGGKGSPYGALETRRRAANTRDAFGTEYLSKKESFLSWMRDPLSFKAEIVKNKHLSAEAKKYLVTVNHVRLMTATPKQLFSNTSDLKTSLISGIFELNQITAKYIMGIANTIGVEPHNIIKPLDPKKSFFGKIFGAIAKDLSNIPGVKPLTSIAKHAINIADILNPFTMGNRIQKGMKGFGEAFQKFMMGKDAYEYAKNPEKAYKDAGFYLKDPQKQVNLLKVQANYLREQLNVQHNIYRAVLDIGKVIGTNTKYERLDIAHDEYSGDLKTERQNAQDRLNREEALVNVFQKAARRGFIGQMSRSLLLQPGRKLRNESRKNIDKANDYDKGILTNLFKSGRIYKSGDAALTEVASNIPPDINFYSDDPKTQKLADSLKVLLYAARQNNPEFDNTVKSAEAVVYPQVNLQSAYRNAKKISNYASILSGKQIANTQEIILQQRATEKYAGNSKMAGISVGKTGLSIIGDEIRNDPIQGLLRSIPLFGAYFGAKQQMKLSKRDILYENILRSAPEKGEKPEALLDNSINKTMSINRSSVVRENPLYLSVLFGVKDALGIKNRTFERMLYTKHYEALYDIFGNLTTDFVFDIQLGKGITENKINKSGKGKSFTYSRKKTEINNIIDNVNNEKQNTSDVDTNVTAQEREEIINQRKQDEINRREQEEKKSFYNQAKDFFTNFSKEKLFEKLGNMSDSIKDKLGNIKDKAKEKAKGFLDFFTSSDNALLKMGLGAGSMFLLNNEKAREFLWDKIIKPLGEHVIFPLFQNICKLAVDNPLLVTGGLGTIFAPKLIGGLFTSIGGGLGKLLTSAGPAIIKFASTSPIGGLGLILGGAALYQIISSFNFKEGKMDWGQLITGNEVSWGNTLGKMATYGFAGLKIGGIYGLIGGLVLGATMSLFAGGDKGREETVESINDWYAETKAKITGNKDDLKKHEQQKKDREDRYAKNGGVRWRVGMFNQHMYTPSVEDIQKLRDLEAKHREEAKGFGPFDESEYERQNDEIKELQNKLYREDEAKYAKGGDELADGGTQAGGTNNFTSSLSGSDITKFGSELIKSSILEALGLGSTAATLLNKTSNIIGGSSNSNYTPTTDTGELGFISAKYESNGKGDTIGYDKVGGTSYGKYQLSTNNAKGTGKGSLHDFISWVQKNKGAQGQEIANALNSAGRLDTGSKTGAGPTVWKELYAKKILTDELQHEFIKANHYDVAFNHLTPDLQKMVAENRALQEVLWSTAVQHGPETGANLIKKVFRPGMNSESLIKAIYAERGTRFPSSSAQVQESVRNRFKNEQQLALGLLMGNTKQNLNSLPNTNGVVWPANSSVITSPFGPRTNVPQGASKDHKGIDIRGNFGEPAKATMDGTVVGVVPNFGGLVIKHQNGLTTRYLHLQNKTVKLGDKVKAGDVIGGIGATGPYKMLPHLHFDVQNESGQKIDPELFFYKSWGNKYNPIYSDKISQNRQFSAKKADYGIGGDEGFGGVRGASLHKNITEYVSEQGGDERQTQVTQQQSQQPVIINNVNSPQQIQQVGSVGGEKAGNTIKTGDNLIDTFLEKVFSAVSNHVTNAIYDMTSISSVS